MLCDIPEEAKAKLQSIKENQKSSLLGVWLEEQHSAFLEAQGRGSLRSIEDICATKMKVIQVIPDNTFDTWSQDGHLLLKVAPLSEGK